MALGLRVELINKELVKKEYLDFIKQLSNEKINLNVNIITKQIQSQVENLQKEFSKLNINVGGVNDFNSSIKNINNDVKNLEKVRLKIVDGNTVQQTEKIRNNLAQTEQLIKNMSKGTVIGIQTTDINTIYKELNNLQKEEFNIKQKIIGANETVTKELEGQLSIIQKQQASVRSLMTNKNLSNQIQENTLLINREKLQSNLNILQEQHNSKEQKTTQEIQKQIELYKQQANIKLQNLQSRYGSLTGNGNIALEIENYKKALNSLSTTNFNSKGLNNQFSQIEANVRSSSLAVKNAQKDVLSFGDACKIAYSKLSIWMGATFLFFGSLREIEHGIQVNYELDRSLNNMNLTMDGTSQKFDAIGKSAMSYSLQLNSSLENTSKAMEIFTNLNATIDEILEKSKPSLILSNLTGKDVSSSADALQGLIYQFDLTSKDAEHLTDVMTKLAASTGVEFSRSIENMTESVARGGSVAKEAGLTAEEYLSIVSTINEVSRLSGDTISAGLSTVFSRISRVSQLGAEEVSKLEKGFNSLGIKIRDNSGEFLDMWAILENIDSVYKNLNSTQRSYIAELAAGVRQKKIFLTLMDSFDEIEQRTTDSMEAEEFAMSRNDIYTQSLSAKMQNLRNVADDMWLKLINNEGIKTFVTDITSIISRISKLTSTLGLLPSTFLIITSSMMLFNKNFRAFGINLLPTIKTKITSLVMSCKELGVQFTLLPQKIKIIGSTTSASATKILFMGMAFDVATIKAITFKAAMIAGTLGLSILVGVITTKLITALDNWIHRAEKLKQLNSDLAQSAQENSKKIVDAESLLSKMESLQSKINNAKSTKESNELKKELLDIQKQIANVLPESITQFDEEGNSISTENKIIKEQIRLKKEQLVLSAKEFFDKNGGIQKIQEEAQAYKKAKEEYEKLKLAQAQGKKFITKKVYSYEGASFDEKIDINKELEEKNKQMQESAKLMGQAITQGNVLNKYNKESIDITKFYTDEIEKNTFAMKDNTEEVDTNTLVKEEQAKVLSDLQKQFENSGENIKEYSAYLKELNTDHKLSADSVNAIIQKHSELIPYLDNETLLREKITQAINKEQNAETEAMRKMLSNNETYYKNKIASDSNLRNLILKNTSDIVDGQGKSYQVDLKNYSNLSQAKVALDNAARIAINDGWASMYDNMERAVSDQAILLHNKMKAHGISDDTGFGEKLDILKGLLKSYSEIDVKMEKLDVSKYVPDYSSLSQPNKSKSKKFLKSKQKVNNLNLEIDALKKYNTIIQDTKNQISSMDKLLGNESLIDKEKVKLINQKIALLEKEEKQYVNLTKAILNERVADKKYLGSKGIHFGNRGEITNYDQLLKLRQRQANSIINVDKKKKAIEQVKDLKDKMDKYTTLTFTTYVDARQAQIDIKNMIRDIGEQKVEIQIEINKNLIEEAKKIIEKSIYDGMTQSEYEDLHNAKINKLQEELDLLNEQNEALEQQENLEEKLKNLNKAKEELSNTKKEKNTLIFRDGKFRWEVNHKNVQEAKEKVAQAQKDYDTTLRNIRLQERRNEIQSQIDYENNQIRIRQEAYERISRDLDEALNDENKLMNMGLGDINKIVDKNLDSLNKVYNNKFKGIIDTIRDNVEKANDELRKLEFAENRVKNRKNSRKSITVNTEIDRQMLKNKYGNDVDITVKNGGGARGVNRYETLKMNEKLLGLSTGGMTLDWTDGDATNGKLVAMHPKEIINNPIDSKYLLKTMEVAKSFMPNFNNIKIPDLSNFKVNNISNEGNKTENNYHIDKVVTEDVDSFMRMGNTYFAVRGAE